MEREILNALPIAAAIFFFRFIAAEAMYQGAQKSSKGFRFPAGFGLRLISRLGGPLLRYAAYKFFSVVTTNFDRGVSIAVTALGMVCLLGEPGPISTTQAGLVQTSLLGLKRKSIGWHGAAARFVPGLREVLIIGSDGTTITHTNYHVGQLQFIHQLKTHGIFVQGFDS